MSKYIKKVSVSPLPRNEASVIDSFDTTDNKRINAPSLRIVANSLATINNTIATRYFNGATTSINALNETGKWRGFISNGSDDANYLGWAGNVVVETFVQSADTPCMQRITRVADGKIIIRNASTSNFSYNDPLTTIYTKTETDNILVNYKLNGDFAVLTGSVSSAGSPTGDIQYAEGTLNYPTGFNKDNCVVISFGVEAVNTVTGYNYSGSLGRIDISNTTYLTGDSVDVLRRSNARSINLATSAIAIRIMNVASSSTTFKYKIVLMKI